MSTINLSVNTHDRLQLSTTIEQLINMLDDLEPDPDLEDTGDDEPWLGWPSGGGMATTAQSFERIGGTGAGFGEGLVSLHADGRAAPVTSRLEGWGELCHCR
jgi:hypothetical protein